MTRERDIERVLKHWLADGVDEMPDRVHLSILDRVERQPQQREQRAWRVSWRSSHVSINLKALAAVAAAIVVAVVGVAVLMPPSSSNVGGPPTPAPSPSPIASASPTDDADWWLAGTSGPCGEAPVKHGCAGPLAPGTHTSGGLQPPVTYVVPEGWVNVRDWATYFSIFPVTQANRTAISAGGDPVTDILVLSLELADASCTDGGPPLDGRSADEIVAAIAAMEGVDPGRTVRIGGLQGREVLVRQEPAWDSSLCSGTQPPEASPGDASVRVTLLDPFDGGHIAVLERNFGGPNQPFVEASEAVVASFEFGSSEGAVPSPS